MPLVVPQIVDWIPVSEAWAYASATTITVPTDATLKYQKGDRIKITQSGSVAYFYIASLTSTVLTVTGGSTYSVANVAISGIYYSRVQNPLGFPFWLPYTDSWTGFSVAPSGGGGVRFSVVGTTVDVNVNRSTAGTSNATTLYLNLPIIGRNSTDRIQGFIGIMDNGTQSQGFYSNDATANATDIHIYKDITGTAFTNSGSKNLYGAFRYEI